MIKTLFAIISLTFLNYSQTVDTLSNILHQPENIIKFADHLFCQKDYLRSANEYLRIDDSIRDEKINFKIALSFSIIGNYTQSKEIFSKMEKNSQYYTSSRLEIMKILFLEEKFTELRKYCYVNDSIKNFAIESSKNKLYFLSFLKDNEAVPSFNEIVNPFNLSEREEVRTLYEMKINPQRKSPVTASILSALIPGAGKFYTGEFSDGIFALITTGVFSFLAYDNFQANHDFRGWLFSGLAVMFYSGNIYGSYASAQIYNSRVKFEFNLRLDLFLKSNHYFIPPYDFCN